MSLIRKIGLGMATAIFSLSAFAVSGSAQDWRYDHNRRDRDRWERRYDNNFYWNNNNRRERRREERRREEWRRNYYHKW